MFRTVDTEKQHILEISLRILPQQWQTATWQASHLWHFAWFSRGASVAHWLAKEAQRSKKSERYESFSFFFFMLQQEVVFFCTQTSTENSLPGTLTPWVSNTQVKIFLFFSALNYMKLCVCFLEGWRGGGWVKIPLIMPARMSRAWILIPNGQYLCAPLQILERTLLFGLQLLPACQNVFRIICGVLETAFQSGWWRALFSNK